MASANDTKRIGEVEHLGSTEEGGEQPVTKAREAESQIDLRQAGRLEVAFIGAWQPPLLRQVLPLTDRGHRVLHVVVAHGRLVEHSRREDVRFGNRKVAGLGQVIDRAVGACSPVIEAVRIELRGPVPREAHEQRVGIRKMVIDARVDVVLLEVLDRVAQMISSEPVGERGCRVEIQKPQRDRVDAGRRNLVAGEWLSHELSRRRVDRLRGRVVQRSGRRARKRLAEVALTHSHGGDGGQHRLRLQDGKALIISEEKRFPTDDWAAERSAELVLPELSFFELEEVPRIKGVVAEELKGEPWNWLVPLLVETSTVPPPRLPYSAE